jgi:hypothetical protein
VAAAGFHWHYGIRQWRRHREMPPAADEPVATSTYITARSHTFVMSRLAESGSGIGILREAPGPTMPLRTAKIPNGAIKRHPLALADADL